MIGVPLATLAALLVVLAGFVGARVVDVLRDLIEPADSVVPPTLRRPDDPA